MGINVNGFAAGWWPEQTGGKKVNTQTDRSNSCSKSAVWPYPLHKVSRYLTQPEEALPG
jgi:hypothetical protein